MRVRTSVLAAAVGMTLVAGLATVPAVAASDPSGPSPLTLYAPGHETVSEFGGKVFWGLDVQVEALDQAFELWSHRDSYGAPISTVWKHDNTETTLPAGTLSSFAGLDRFLDVTIQDNAGHRIVHRQMTVCLNGYGYRAVPSGAAHSPYPYDCPTNIFTRGSVQGIAAGWASDVPLFGYRGLKLAKGSYKMRVSITAKYRKLFGISAADGHRSVNVKVVKADGGGPRPVPIPVRSHRAHAAPAHLTGHRLDSAPSGPEPDLAALPAWGIGISRDGNHLQFSATVWNAGDSPLVVEGFREKGKPLMDAYQYFFDADGNQTGYVPAGHMEWDPRPTHLHWHFEDFARYQLLDANQTKVQRSKKEAFCLANTDAIDYTVPGANWKPDNTDLATDCGDYNSIAVSEVLASGSGDTYEQFRAGQSFDLRSLNNGIYYISVDANPDNVLTESSTANNERLRKVRIGGTAGHRTVYVYPVGDVTG